jgi:rhodanese-related sulfurtransferase
MYMPKTALELVMEAKAQVDNVTPIEAQAEISSGRAVLLDVREPVEWEHHIAGAVQVPRGLLEFAADPTSPRHRPELDPNRRVIVYCRSGVRAVLAGATLKTLGFGDVANLDGGITAWKEAGLPLAEHHEGV